MDNDERIRSQKLPTDGATRPLLLRANRIKLRSIMEALLLFPDQPSNFRPDRWQAIITFA